MSRRTPALVFAGFALLLLHPLLLDGEVFYFRDFGRYYAPVKAVCLDRMLSGEFPLWLPELNCGTPVHGELVHGLLYPANALLLFGESRGWGLYFALHVFLAGIGAFVLAKRFRASDTAALAAGLAYAGSGYLVAQLNHVPYATAAAWIPFVIHLGLRTGDGRPAAAPLLAVVLALTALAGEPFTLLLGLLVLFVLVLFGFTESRRRAILGIGLAGAVALLLSSPALLPAWAQLPESVRARGAAPEDLYYGSVHPVRLVTLLSPEALGRQQIYFPPEVKFFGATFRYAAPVITNLHLGALTLLALVAACVRRRRLRLVLLGMFATAVLFSLGAYLGISTTIAEAIPGLALFRYPDKYWLVATIAASVLVGVTLDDLDRRMAKPAWVLAGIAFVLGIALAGEDERLGVAILSAAPLALSAFVLGRDLPSGRKVLVAILFVDLLVHGVRVNATTPPETLTKESVAHVLRKVDPPPVRIFTHFQEAENEIELTAPELLERCYNGLESNVGLPFGFSYSFGYDPVEPIVRVSKYFGLDRDTPPADLTFLRHRLLRLVDNTHSITNADLAREGAVYQVIAGPHGYNVWAYRDPMPRARLYGNTVAAPDMDAARKLTTTISFDAYRNLVLDGEGIVEIGNGEPVGSVRFLVDEPERVRLEVESDRLAWLFLADAWSGGWKATVNGRDVKIAHALVGFRAVPVNQGKSIVEFRYEPDWLGVVPFTFGIGILALLALAVPWWRCRVRRRRPAEPDAPASA